MRGRLAATLALAGFVLLALGSAAANATTYCVANPSGTFVAPSSGFAHSSTTAANSVEVVGAGADATTLSPPAGAGDGRGRPRRSAR